MEYAFTILREGTSADRQLARYEESGGDFKAVVDMLIDETREGVVVADEPPAVAQLSELAIISENYGSKCPPYFEI